MNNTTTKTYVLFQNTIRLLKDKRNYEIKNKSDQSIPNIHLDNYARIWCNN